MRKAIIVFFVVLFTAASYGKSDENGTQPVPPCPDEYKDGLKP